MTHTLFPDNEPSAHRKIKRPVMSDSDGMREGALALPIVFILGFVGASIAHPAALMSFWVWFALLMMSVAVARGVQRAAAWLYGHQAEDAE
ncbi:hypothetical protein [Tateyamaria sp. SN3-11]|uniref:hypothetical protein n=1 Tax=Tateyamaria sp. SN3-11 TaxID=3092147 RepID=UPI0039EA360B